MQDHKRIGVWEAVLGVFLIAIGIAFFFIPFVPGIPFVLAGLALLGFFHKKHA